MRLSLKRSSLLSLGLLASVSTAGLSFADLPPGYTGKPWKDSVQVVPGRLEPEKHDEGASRMSWYDGSGGITGGYKVRSSDVDLDFVTGADSTWSTSTVRAEKGGIYWGWLQANEWVKMTVDVKEAGTYAVHAMVGTNIAGTSFKVDALNGSDSVSTGAVVLPFPGSAPGKCPGGKECYHFWNYVKNIGQLNLKAGRQVIRLQIVKEGYNVEYVVLEAAGATGIKTGRNPAAESGLKSASSASKVFDASGRNLKRASKIPTYQR